MISLKQFRYFVEIVDAGSYSRAAEKLSIAPSALSRQIKNWKTRCKRCCSRATRAKSN